MADPTELRRLPTSVGYLAFADEGEGTPVVLWPSLFSDHRLFTHVVSTLGEGWRCVRIDGPGFGRSDPPRGVVQPGEYARAVLELLDALNIEQAIIAGCSWGGQVAAHVGASAPERTHGVMLMNTPLGPSLGGHAFEVHGTRWFGSTRFWGGGVARSMFAPATRKASPERVGEFVDAFPSFDRSAASVTVRTVMTQSPGLGNVLPRLAVPTTILMGAEDRLYPVEAMRPHAQLVPAARLEIVSGCGHLAPLEAPQAVASALRELATRSTA